MRQLRLLHPGHETDQRPEKTAGGCRIPRGGKIRARISRQTDHEPDRDRSDRAGLSVFRAGHSDGPVHSFRAALAESGMEREQRHAPNRPEDHACPDRPRGRVRRREADSAGTSRERLGGWHGPDLGCCQLVQGPVRRHHGCDQQSRQPARGYFSYAQNEPERIVGVLRAERGLRFPRRRAYHAHKQRRGILFREWRHAPGKGVRGEFCRPEGNRIRPEVQGTGVSPGGQHGQAGPRTGTEPASGPGRQ